MKTLLACALLIAAATLGASAAHADGTAGLVDVGAGRSLFLDCQGSAPTGTPSVFVIPGRGGYADAWNAAIPLDDPIRSSPYDLMDEANPGLDPVSTQPIVAKATQICTYDRPGTRPDGVDLSTPVPQPHTVQQDVDDVIALIDAAHLPMPMVFVAHSYGALVLDLLARTHPELVSGLVFAEPTSEYLPIVGRADQNAAFDANGVGNPGGEAILPADAYARIAAAPPLPRVPAIVLSGDRFPPPSVVKPADYTQPQIRRANDMLAAALGTTNETVPDSGHNVMLYQPQALADHIVTVVDQVRAER